MQTVTVVAWWVQVCWTLPIPKMPTWLRSTNTAMVLVETQIKSTGNFWRAWWRCLEDISSEKNKIEGLCRCFWAPSNDWKLAYRKLRWNKNDPRSRGSSSMCTRESISAIKLASFGTPLGACGSFQKRTCHAPNSHEVLEKMCVWREKCEVVACNGSFEADPCPNVLKRLAVEAVCSDGVTETSESNSMSWNCTSKRITIQCLSFHAWSRMRFFKTYMKNKSAWCEN